MSAMITDDSLRYSRAIVRDHGIGYLAGPAAKVRGVVWRWPAMSIHLTETRSPGWNWVSTRVSVCGAVTVW
ncbi:MAG TPA: hypothetical protein VMV92_01890, partial [Streptosporangiaceae bacterium]|nr:hypothetical protein [Streptosporangiaceae bacterium]